MGEREQPGRGGLDAAVKYPFLSTENTWNSQKDINQISNKIWNVEPRVSSENSN